MAPRQTGGCVGSGFLGSCPWSFRQARRSPRAPHWASRVGSGVSWRGRSACPRGLAALSIFLVHVCVAPLSLCSDQPAGISHLFSYHRDEKVLKVLQTRVFGRMGVGRVFSWPPACPAFLVPITGCGEEGGAQSCRGPICHLPSSFTGCDFRVTSRNSLSRSESRCCSLSPCKSFRV